MVINIDPVLLYINGMPIVRWYGLMYVVGIVVSLWVMTPYARERGLSEDDVYAIFWPAAILGLLGARLYYVVQSDPLSYLSQPWRILATWEGGMAFYGAIFGAALGIFIVARRRKLNLWSILDAGAIFAVLGQAFGRIGNIINGDVVGYPTDLPWGFIYTHPNSFVPEKGIAYQPAAVYELIFNVLFFLLLWSIRRKLLTPGLLFCVWLIGYSLGQILIFATRMNVVIASIGGIDLKQAQLTALVVILATIPFLLNRLSVRRAFIEAEGAVPGSGERQKQRRGAKRGK